jgi:hypothetical protein
MFNRGTKDALPMHGGNGRKNNGIKGIPTVDKGVSKIPLLFLHFFIISWIVHAFLLSVMLILFILDIVFCVFYASSFSVCFSLATILSNLFPALSLIV